MNLGYAGNELLKSIMHGRQRRLTEKTDDELKQEKLKAAKLKAAGVSVLSKIKEKDYSKDVYMLSGVLAKLNPDIYTIWNYRKDYISRILESETIEEEVKQKLLDMEVKLTEEIIRDKDTKCYPLWNHRRWVFSRQPSLLTDHELLLCEQLLKLDQRNFHCWNHWALICKQMNVPLERCLAFTWKRIQENASNYSAWHYRGELTKQLIESQYNTETDICDRLIDAEFESNLNALYTECDDQSSWYYVRSLFYIMMDLERQAIVERQWVLQHMEKAIADIQELIDFVQESVYGDRFVAELCELKNSLNESTSH